MTAFLRSGKVLEISYDLVVRLKSDNGKESTQRPSNQTGRVICPNCGKKSIARVLPETRGHLLSGHCKMCKEWFWFDVID